MKSILALGVALLAAASLSSCAHKEKSAEAAQTAAATCTEMHAGHDHNHGPNCGHEGITHEGHTDYKHDGHAHFVHGNHVDEHGKVAMDTCPHSECKCKGKCGKNKKSCKGCDHCQSCHGDGSKCPGPTNG